MAALTRSAPRLRAEPSPSSSSAASRAAGVTDAPMVDDEHRARKCGRLFAKQIFEAPQHWKVIGTHPTDHVEIFEDTATTTTLRSVRALRKLHGALEDVESVLSATHRSQLYAKLLPELYASGGCIADYGPIKHDTGEREYANTQFAMHRSYFWTGNEERPLGGSLDHHLFLEYLLQTKLQRSQIASKSDGTTTTKVTPVASLLYVLRPVHVETFSERHAEFEPHRLANTQFSVTYVVQQETKYTLSLEVVLTCSFPEPEDLIAARASNMSEMYRLVVALTRLQPFVDLLVARRRPTTSTPHFVDTSPIARRTEMASPVADRQSTRAKVRELFHKDKHHSRRKASCTDDESNEGSGGCATCHKRFHAFRWKKRCEVCLRSVCDPCLSTIANPGAIRKKKRVCGECLYGGTQSGFERVTGAANAFARDAQLAADEVSRARARTDAPLFVHARYDANNSSATNTGPSSSRRYTAPENARRRAQTVDVRVSPPQPPAPVSAPAPAPVLVAEPSPAPSPPTPTAIVSSWASEEQTGITKHEIELNDDSVSPYKSNSFYDETDPTGVVSDDEFVTAMNRSRRAQTIEIGDIPVKRVERKRASSRSDLPAVPSRVTTTRTRGYSFSNDQSDVKFNAFTLHLTKKKSSSSLSASKRSTMQFRQLKTPAIKYDLDFDWLNPFPKAPMPTGTKERERVDFMSTHMKMNAHTAMVNLRRDTVLEDLTQTAMGSLATQWDGCSIHLIGERQVFCLAYGYQEPLPVDSDAIDVVTEDVVAREESASSYALYHQSAFFVPDLSADDRFRAHPLHTDAHINAYLSLPIYATQGRCPVIATLDLWRFDPSGVSSHVSHDWWTKMERLLTKIARRIEELSLLHAGHTIPNKTRAQKARSVGSSCDSRGSTRKDDSFEMDLRDLMEEQELGDDQDERVIGWTTTPREHVTRPRRHTVADQYDIRQNGSFVSSRDSSSSDFESTIESLLNQAKRTSEYVREQSQVHTC